MFSWNEGNKSKNHTGYKVRLGNYSAEVTLSGDKWLFHVWGEQDCIEQGECHNLVHGIWKAEQALARAYDLQTDLLRQDSPGEAWEDFVGDQSPEEFLVLSPYVSSSDAVKYYIDQLNVLFNSHYTEEQLAVIGCKLTEYIDLDAKRRKAEPGRAGKPNGIHTQIASSREQLGKATNRFKAARSERGDR